MGKKEPSGAKSHVSNLPHYAATGVKAQAFVRVLFAPAAKRRGSMLQSMHRRRPHLSEKPAHSAPFDKSL